MVLAKLDVSLGHILDARERKTYLNPARDLIWDLSRAIPLFEEGLKLVLLGNDVPILKQRLQHTKDYLRRSKNSRKLQIYLIGAFPILKRTSSILPLFCSTTS